MAHFDITSAIEGILFAAGEPVTLERLGQILEIDDKAVEYAVLQLEKHYNENERGIRLLRIEDSAQLCSAPEYADVIRRVLEKRRVPQLGPTALEVLAIIAYFQPVTRAYVERIRGVDSSYTVGVLQSRGLIERSGQLQVPGRPSLFRTTKTFLRAFGLTNLAELPPLPDVDEDSEAKTQLKAAIEAIQREQEARKSEEAIALAGQDLFTAEAGEEEMEEVTTDEVSPVDKPDTIIEDAEPITEE
ncbi:MAG: SMC-Scp complex subunit ScpB [Oscillospiraceae bacterium]|nr:SMC-Scp complex subunit ScpB [Oscillospiraceae bacterium]